MPSPQLIEQKPISLGDAKEIITHIEKRDTQLNFISNKTKEYLETFVTISAKKREELAKKLAELGITRLKEDIIAKIIDFMPTEANDLKVILSGYNITLTKKDQDSIVEVVGKFVKE
jgi:DNA-directed RNA polymerase subunit F